MTFRKFLVAGALAASLALSACSPVAPASKPAPPTPAPSATASPTPTPSSQLTVNVDGVTFAHAGRSETVPFTDTTALLALVSDAVGASPAVSKVEDLPGYSFNLTAYDWTGLKVVSNGTNASISATSARVGGVTIQTGQGIAVGSTRADLLTLRPTEIADENSDGVPDDFGVEPQEEPGTNSLSHPGSVGITYILVIVDGDLVKQIQSPANDFSDI